MRRLLALAVLAIAMPARAQRIGVGLSIPEVVLRARPVTVVVAPTFMSSLDFSDARNSQYLPLL